MRMSKAQREVPATQWCRVDYQGKQGLGRRPLPAEGRACGPVAAVRPSVPPSEAQSGHLRQMPTADFAAGFR